MTRIDFLDLERLRAIDPTLSGAVPAAASFVTWLRCAMKSGAISDDRQGYYLDEAQWANWQAKGMLP